MRIETMIAWSARTSTDYVCIESQSQHRLSHVVAFICSTVLILCLRSQPLAPLLNALASRAPSLAISAMRTVTECQASPVAELYRPRWDLPAVRCHLRPVDLL